MTALNHTTSLRNHTMQYSFDCSNIIYTLFQVGICYKTQSQERHSGGSRICAKGGPGIQIPQCRARPEKVARGGGGGGAGPTLAIKCLFLSKFSLNSSKIFQNLSISVNKTIRYISISLYGKQFCPLSIKKKSMYNG